MGFKFQDVSGKMGNMRKVVEWTVCPRADATERNVTIQADKRIARINLDTGKAMLSDGKGGHQGFHKLLPFMGAVEVDCPADMLESLRKLDIPAGPIVLMG